MQVANQIILFWKHCDKSIYIAENEKVLNLMKNDNKTSRKFGGESFWVQSNETISNCKVKSHRGWSPLKKSDAFRLFEVIKMEK